MTYRMTYRLTLSRSMYMCIGGISTMVNVIFLHAPFLKNAFEKEMSILLEEALAPAVRLHMYPKSIIDVFVHVLQFDASPSTLAAAITAASIAIADAGIEMRDIVIGSVVQQRGQHWMVDPDSTEVCDNEACLLVAALPAFNEITHLRAVGGRHGLSASELVQVSFALSFHFGLFLIREPKQVSKRLLNCIPCVRIVY